MPVHGRLFSTLCVCVALSFGVARHGVRAGEEPPAKSLSFEENIRPLLQSRCFRCHGDKTHKAGLDLTTAAGILKGGESGPAVVLGKPDESPLFRSTGSPVLNLRPDTERPANVTPVERDLLTRLDFLHKQQHPGQPNLDARIASYELAARMQLVATDALDISTETAAAREQYGIGREPTDSYGRRCLIARRLVERGVRFVQLFINGQIWDTHTALAAELRTACARTDQPVAPLLRDLKQRGLFDSTLVVWGGEFGRLPIAQLPADKVAWTPGSRPLTHVEAYDATALVLFCFGGCGILLDSGGTVRG
jgi:hypothetical protein